MSIKTGNLFVLAEKQLIKEKNNGKRRFYTTNDIIDYTVFIRTQLDKREKEIKRSMNLSIIEKKQIKAKKRRQYYLEKGK